MKNTLLLFLLVIGLQSMAQNRFQTIENDLHKAAKTLTGLNNEVKISINQFTVQEIIRAVAHENDLNVSISADINASPSYNFADAKVKDVFLFLCKEHDLYIEWTGNIISFKKFETPEAPVQLKQKKSVNLSINPSSKLFSGELRNDTLFDVVNRLVKISGINVDVDEKLKYKVISMTIMNQKFEDVLTRLSVSNEWKKVSENYYSIVSAPKKVEIQERSNSKYAKNKKYGSRKRNARKGSSEISIEKVDTLLNVSAKGADLKDLVEEVCIEAGINYYLFDEPKGNLTLEIKEQTFESTLSFLLNSSEFTYRIIDDVYIIGKRKEEKLRHTEVFQLQYRSTENIINVIPSDIKKNVEVNEYPELNSIILSGSLPEINEVIYFLEKVDQVVPMVLIEVMIVDINRQHTIKTGMKIARDNNANTDGTFGSTRPGELDMTLNSNTLNTIINSINNLGFFNLGEIGNGFYLSMQALEENGNVKIKHTPKLAALNGHEAKMSIGETKYYSENQTNVIGTQNPQTVSTVTYKPVEASLSLNIKPTVSGDDQITLEITVSQSDFTTQVGLAPPEFEKREFQSFIRMKNKEMVVLGGLENTKRKKSESGVPVLSRIPVLNWLTGNKTKEKVKSELTVFIRPTVIK